MRYEGLIRPIQDFGLCIVPIRLQSYAFIPKQAREVLKNFLHG